MPELFQTDGNYEAYLAQLFNPLASGAQFNPGGLGGIGTGIGGLGTGAVPNMGSPLQNPWGTPYPQQLQYPQQLSAIWPQQNPLAQQIAAKQAMQVVQHAQAVQALKQLVHNLAMQSQINTQTQHGGYGVGGLYGQIGQGLPQSYGIGTQNPFQQQQLQQQMLQQQALQQIAQYLATQQPSPFRYGLA